MMMMIQKESFRLDYELPLNKRFIAKFMKILEPKGFVVADSLSQDKNNTMFGKSQPDLTIYRSRGKYIKGKSVMGASIYSDQKYEVYGTTVE